MLAEGFYTGTVGNIGTIELNVILNIELNDWEGLSEGDQAWVKKCAKEQQDDNSYWCISNVVKRFYFGL